MHKRERLPGKKFSIQIVKGKDSLRWVCRAHLDSYPSTQFIYCIVKPVGTKRVFLYTVYRCSLLVHWQCWAILFRMAGWNRYYDVLCSISMQYRNAVANFKVKWGNSEQTYNKTLRLQTLLADINFFFYMGEFFSLQTFSSIILIALCLQNCARKNILSPNAEITWFG